jgi:hypothetical protein
MVAREARAEAQQFSPGLKRVFDMPEIFASERENLGQRSLIAV